MPHFSDPGPGAVDYIALFRGIPTSYLVMDPDFVILDANDTYLANVGRTREEILGRPVFEAFPPTADTLDDDGVPRILKSFELARATKRLDTMPLQKYDIPDAAGTGMVERWWSLISVPILDDQGDVVLIVQRAENITDFIQERERGDAERELGEQWRQRVQEVEADLYARALELTAALRAKETVSRRLSGLVEVALALGSAETVAEMARVVFETGLPVLQASGGSIAVRATDSEMLHMTVTESLGVEPARSDTQLALHGPMPSSIAARGTEVLVRDEREAAAHEGLADVMARSGSKAWAVLPLRAGSRLLGALAVGFPVPQEFPSEELELLRAFAAQCAQVLDRLQVREAERRAAAEVQRIAETLQRSLLTHPPDSVHLAFAVHYQPAQQVAQVGGDWYDAFHVSDGSTSVVIGDVAGHDQDAAAAMAQVRNILRGIAQTVGEPPAAVLDALDCAMQELRIGVLATVVLAQIGLPAGPGRERSLLWCNAGHPAPLLVRADGTVELLLRDPELLVGLLRESDRHDHAVVLRPGDTLLLYTDGLVETRGGDIEADMERLRSRVLAHDPTAGPQALLDMLTADAAAFNDDVALLAVQAV